MNLHVPSDIVLLQVHHPHAQPQVGPVPDDQQLGRILGRRQRPHDRLVRAVLVLTRHQPLCFGLILTIPLCRLLHNINSLLAAPRTSPAGDRDGRDYDPHTNRHRPHHHHNSRDTSAHYRHHHHHRDRSRDRSRSRSRTPPRGRTRHRGRGTHSDSRDRYREERLPRCGVV
jgi:hypothetical protein